MWFQSLSLSSEMPLCEWEKTHTCPYNPLHQVLKPLLKIQAIAWIILCMVFGTGHKKRKGSETSEHHRSPEIQEINATSPHIYICLLFCCRNVILLKKCCFYADNVVCYSAVVLFWWKLCWFLCKLCCFRANCTIYRNLRCFVTKYAGLLMKSQIWDLVPSGTKVQIWSQKSPNFACKSQIDVNLV